MTMQKLLIFGLVLTALGCAEQQHSTTSSPRKAEAERNTGDGATTATEFRLSGPAGRAGAVKVRRGAMDPLGLKLAGPKAARGSFATYDPKTGKLNGIGEVKNPLLPNETSYKNLQGESMGTRTANADGSATWKDPSGKVVSNEAATFDPSTGKANGTAFREPGSSLTTYADENGKPAGKSISSPDGTAVHWGADGKLSGRTNKDGTYQSANADGSLGPKQESKQPSDSTRQAAAADASAAATDPCSMALHLADACANPDGEGDCGSGLRLAGGCAGGDADTCGLTLAGDCAGGEGGDDAADPAADAAEDSSVEPQSQEPQSQEPQSQASSQGADDSQSQPQSQTQSPPEE